MKSRTVLVQWIGHSDLRAMAATLPDTKRKQVLDRIRGKASDSTDLGPTKTGSPPSMLIPVDSEPQGASRGLFPATRG